MIYLSAQPDTLYFIWQLEVQLFNFVELGIKAGEIHVLFAYDPATGISAFAKNFSETWRDKGSFYFYPDYRIDKQYASSVRPHIIKQHFQVFPELKFQSVFYHDSDIIFTDKLPDFNRLCESENWYVSDARSYLDTKFINEKGAQVLQDMCDVVGIDTATVILNDENAGGAQVLLKGADYRFWNKVEEDCLKLYLHLTEQVPNHIAEYSKLHPERKAEYVPINAWCADMWAILWNAFQQFPVKIDKDLDFCWPQNNLQTWESTNIFHNAGVIKEQADRFFFKTDYYYKYPYHLGFEFIDPECCSAKYVGLIARLNKSRRFDLSDATIIIPIRIDSEDRISNLFTILRYLSLHFIINIIILEADNIAHVDKSKLPDNVQYIFIEDHDSVLHREKYTNFLTKNVTTKILIKYDCDVILPPSQLYNAAISVRYSDCEICYPYDGRFINIKGALRDYFKTSLNIETLHKYSTMPTIFLPSFGGCVVLDRNAYINIGMDNENFYGWGFEDQELYKRALILECRIRREEGPLFHLDHERKSNSYFANDDELFRSYREYLQVCSMTKNRLASYVRNWKSGEISLNILNS